MKNLTTITLCTMVFSVGCIGPVNAVRGYVRKSKRTDQRSAPSSPQVNNHNNNQVTQSSAPSSPQPQENNNNNNALVVDQLERGMDELSLESSQGNAVQNGAVDSSEVLLVDSNNGNQSNNSELEIIEVYQPSESNELKIELKSEIEANLENVINNVTDEALVSDVIQKDLIGELFQVAFKDEREKEYFTRCNNYQFCDFISRLDAKMNEPEVVSMVRNYGFGLGHVPLLLVWSSYLYNRLAISRIHCSETKNFKDILKLMLIIDLRAQVDAACIVHMKENSQSHNALVVQADSVIIEKNSACASETAQYLKRKLVELWKRKIEEVYNNKKLPCFTTILEEVKQLATQWQEDQLQSPIWVCCVMHKSWMGFNNMFSGWQSEKFGNWWNPVQQLITACQSCDYSQIRDQKTREVIGELEMHTTWADYFGNLLALQKDNGAEYDSDGGF